MLLILCALSLVKTFNAAADPLRGALRRPVPVVVAHGDPHGQAAPCSLVRQAARTRGRG